jgi:hypothetical protein
MTDIARIPAQLTPEDSMLLRLEALFDHHEEDMSWDSDDLGWEDDNDEEA